jgi:hypothetical protein
MTLHEIEKHVAELPPEQLAAFADWFAEFKSDQWDRQIEADAKAGRLDQLIREAKDERDTGLTRPI